MFRLLRHIEVVDIKIEVLDTLLGIVVMGAHVDANYLNTPELANEVPRNCKRFIQRVICLFRAHRIRSLAIQIPWLQRPSGSNPRSGANDPEALQNHHTARDARTPFNKSGHADHRWLFLGRLFLGNREQ